MGGHSEGKCINSMYFVILLNISSKVSDNSNYSLLQIREVHDKTNFKPDIRGSVSGSHSPSYLFSPRSASSSSPRRVSASDALEIALSPLLKSPAGGLGGVEEKGEEDEGEIFTFDHGSIAATEGTDCKGGGGTRGSLVVVITSDDRLEITLSPGAIETILKIAEVHYVSFFILVISLFVCLFVLIGWQPG